MIDFEVKEILKDFEVQAKEKQISLVLNQDQIQNLQIEMGLDQAVN